LKTASLPTVFLGSGLLFLAMLFASAAVAAGIIIAYAAGPAGLLDSATFTFARAVTYEIMNLYAVKMAAVFMISTSTLAIRTGVIAGWIALLGYALAPLLHGDDVSRAAGIRSASADSASEEVAHRRSSRRARSMGYSAYATFQGGCSGPQWFCFGRYKRGRPSRLTENR
jgi:hypothetical protein